LKIIVPKRYVRLKYEYDNMPLLYLAGPVRGGGDWQQRMCRAIELQHPDSIIVVPIRWTESHPLAPYFLPADKGTAGHFPQQRHFEWHYLDQAGELWWPRCIIFWLGTQRDYRPPEDGPYGQDTLGEVGEWRGRMMHNPAAHVVIGGESGFPGFEMIQANFSHRIKRNFPIYTTMEETVAAALEVAHASLFVDETG
jgi:hypothetical protein